VNSEQRVAETVWPWRTPPQAPAIGVWARRRRALLQGIVTAAIATFLTWRLGRYRLGLFLYCFSAGILICGFLAPKAFDILERMGQKLAHVVALALTWILLLPFFYLCFAPAHLVLKLMGKDPMRRRFDRKRRSYWVDHKPPTAPQPYTRQY
jgi:hypothetical protein